MWRLVKKLNLQTDVDGLVLTSEVALDGINITRFDGKQLIALGGQNVVKCTSDSPPYTKMRRGHK